MTKTVKPKDTAIYIRDVRLFKCLHCGLRYNRLRFSSCPACLQEFMLSVRKSAKQQRNVKNAQE
jgi:hypothetical protein